MVTNKVAWLEGMMLQPQHFQQQDTYINHRFEQLLQHSQPHLWGVSAVHFNDSLLAVGKLSLDSAKGQFADGSVFDLPHTDHLPNPITLSEKHANSHVYLGLPIRGTGTAEVGSAQVNERYRYCAINKDIRDNTADSQKIDSIQVSALAPCLLTDADDRSQFHCIPLAKLAEVKTGSLVQFDQQFIPSIMDISCSTNLYALITEIHDIISIRAEALSARLIDKKARASAEVLDFLLLQLCNKYQAIFRYLQQAKQTHPETLYRLMHELLAELATYTARDRRPTFIPNYNHADLFQTFKPLIVALRTSLGTVLEQQAVRIPVQQQKANIWVSILPDRNMLRDSVFVLAVRAELPADQVSQMLTTHIKIAPLEVIGDLVGRGLPGISIKPLAVAPRQIPYHSQSSYFVFEQQNQLWEMLGKSSGVAIHVGTPIPGIRIEVWAIKQET